MEDMAHLMEECRYIEVSHECWPLRCRLREISNHGCHRIVPFPVRKLITRDDTKYSSMREFGL